MLTFRPVKPSDFLKTIFFQLQAMSLSALIKQKALHIGFSACGIAQAEPAESQAFYFDRWIAEGCHAGMQYMENHRDIRLNPDGLLPGARSVISVALNYYPPVRRKADDPHIAYYAYGEDYHTVVKTKLRQLWKAITDEILPSLAPSSTETTTPAARCFTDSAPLLERYWAWKAGLGFIGKNTHLILPGKGSFFFLGEIVTTLAVDTYDPPQKSRCGSCTRCLDACPTAALRPHHLDAGCCLSYLTIEHKGDIPPSLAARLGNRLYGCDTCQLVCPWNRFAVPTTEKAFSPTPGFLSLQKNDLRTLTHEQYNRIFAHSAVKRAKYEGLLRTLRCLYPDGDSNPSVEKNKAETD